MLTGMNIPLLPEQTSTVLNIIFQHYCIMKFDSLMRRNAALNRRVLERSPLAGKMAKSGMYMLGQRDLMVRCSTRRTSYSFETQVSIV